MSVNRADDMSRSEQIDTPAHHLFEGADAVRSSGNLAQTSRVRRPTGANYPIQGLVTSAPFNPATEHADEFKNFAKYIDLLRLTGQLGDGYVLATRRDEKALPEVWHSASDSPDAAAEEVRKLRRLPAKVRQRELERLTAYCSSGCELVVVYRTQLALLVYVGGTSIVGGAGARLQAVRCSHRGYVFPSLSRILALTPRSGPRRTVDMSALNQGH